MSLDLLDGTGLARKWPTAAGVVAVSLLAWLVEPLIGTEGWVGRLSTTVNVWEAAVALVPSLVCGFAAWVSGQAHAHGVDEWSATSPRSAAGRIAPSLFLVGGAAVVTQVIATLVLAVVSIRYGMLQDVKGLDLLLSVPTMTAYLLVWTAVGAALGRSMRLLVALPVAAVLPYFVYYMSIIYLSEGPAGALVIGDGRVYDYVRPATLVVVTRALFWVVLAVVAWSRLLGRPRVSIAAGWTASIAAALAFMQGPSIVAFPGATDPICRGTSPVACLDGSHESTMEPYRKAIDRLWGSVPIPLRPAAVVSTSEVMPTGTDFGLVVPPVAGLLTVARVVDDSMFAAKFGEALFYGACSETSKGTDTAAALTLWWRTRLGIPPDRPAFIGDGRYGAADTDFERHDREARSFARTPQTEQDSWFQVNRDRLLTCAAPALPAP
jgi:hypothetical protein